MLHSPGVRLRFVIGRTIDPAQFYDIYEDVDGHGMIARKLDSGYRYCAHVHESADSLARWMSAYSSAGSLCPKCERDGTAVGFGPGSDFAMDVSQAIMSGTQLDQTLEEEQDLITAIERAEVEWEEQNPQIVMKFEVPAGINEHWHSPLAKKRFLVLSEFLGSPNSVGQDSSGNFAVWIARNKTSEDQTGWYQIELRDRVRLHWVPQAHVDFLKLTIHRYIPSHRLDDVRKLSQSVSYEPSTGRLSAMCHFMGANVATLALALDVCDGRYSLDEAHRVYGSVIASTLHPSYGRAAYLLFLKRIGLEDKSPRFPSGGSLFDGVGAFFNSAKQNSN